jgi:hypothetical protein
MFDRWNIRFVAAIAASQYRDYDALYAPLVAFASVEHKPAPLLAVQAAETRQ